MRLNKTLFFVLFFTFVLIFSIAGCSTQNNSRLKVVTGTSLLACIVREIGGDRVEVVNLIPPAQHPGNFNVRPGDVETLASAKLFLLHGWPGEGYADQLIASANNPTLTVFRASVDGNWMIPNVQSVATDKVAAALSQIDGNNASAYQASAVAYKQKIALKSAEIESRLKKAKVNQVNIMSSARQADFLNWADLNVVATYGGPNILNPQTVKELIDRGIEAKVNLVVDNLQDGKDAGKGIAEELNAKQVNLSNFPGGFDNTETWEKAIERNIELLITATTN